MLRGLLSRVQSPDPGLAPRRQEQGPGCEVDPDPHHAPAEAIAGGRRMNLQLQPVIRLPRTSVAKGAVAPGERVLLEETPVALTYNGSTHAVMMASPSDLEDFALGFSLSEGIIAGPGDLLSTEIIQHDLGCEIRMWLSDSCSGSYRTRRRAMAGPVGCGLCGVESLTEALRPAPLISDTVI